MDFMVVIPARWRSSRFPGKALVPICGKPMIVQTYVQCTKAVPMEKIVVATDDTRISSVCREHDIPCVMTSVECLTGTDRVAEVASRPRYDTYQYIANVQGDEPLLREPHLRMAIDLVRDKGWDVGTCATPIVGDEARTDASVVKVARAVSGRALYFSRAPIPFKRDEKPTRDDLGHEPFLRHVGIYAYTRDALHDWVALAPSQLERIEDLEQLRPVEAGLRIGVGIVDSADPGVDTAADILRMEEKLSPDRAATLA